MNDFIAKYQDQLSGTLSGFDRLVFRGTLWKNQLTGMSGYLWLTAWEPRTLVRTPKTYPSG